MVGLVLVAVGGAGAVVLRPRQARPAPVHRSARAGPLRRRQGVEPAAPAGVLPQRPGRHRLRGHDPLRHQRPAAGAAGRGRRRDGAARLATSTSTRSASTSTAAPGQAVPRRPRRRHRRHHDVGHRGRVQRSCPGSRTSASRTSSSAATTTRCAPRRPSRRTRTRSCSTATSGGQGHRPRRASATRGSPPTPTRPSTRCRTPVRADEARAPPSAVAGERPSHAGVAPPTPQGTAGPSASPRPDWAASPDPEVRAGGAPLGRRPGLERQPPRRAGRGRGRARALRRRRRCSGTCRSCSPGTSTRGRSGSTRRAPGS